MLRVDRVLRVLLIALLIGALVRLVVLIIRGEWIKAGLGLAWAAFMAWVVFVLAPWSARRLVRTLERRPTGETPEG
jgi:hypothetical protein